MQFRRHRRDLHCNPARGHCRWTTDRQGTRPHLDARLTKITLTALHHYQGRNFHS
jgi:hypothetical protein